VLAELGIVPTGNPPPLGHYQGSLNGVLHQLPTDHGSLLRTSLLGARSMAQLGMLLSRRPRMNPSGLTGISTREWLNDTGLRPDAEAVVLALLRLQTYCPDVDQFAADAALAQLQIGVLGGVLYLDHGWSQLTDALSAASGVRTSTQARALQPAADRIEVGTDKGPVIARQVVVAVGPPAGARSLLPEPPDWGELGGPVAAACLDLGVRRVPRPGYVLGIDVPLYATIQGPPARQAPAGQALVSVLRYGNRSAELDRPELDAHRRLCGVSDEDVAFERFLTSMMVARTMPKAELGEMPGRPSAGDTGTLGIHMAGAADLFTNARPRLVGLAYRILGSLADAEDVVSEVWFRWARAERNAPERPQAWLTTVTTRVALDPLRARKRRAADYPGQWLPEPIIGGRAPMRSPSRPTLSSSVPHPARRTGAGGAGRLRPGRGVRRSRRRDRRS
jgi:hypothetical protein